MHIALLKSTLLGKIGLQLTQLCLGGGGDRVEPWIAPLSPLSVNSKVVFTTNPFASDPFKSPSRLFSPPSLLSYSSSVPLYPFAPFTPLVLFNHLLSRLTRSTFSNFSVPQIGLISSLAKYVHNSPPPFCSF